MWPRRRNSTWRLPLLLLLLALLSETAFAAAETPRYVLVRAPNPNSGPRVVIFAIPHVTWRELRRADMPNVHFLMEHGAVGLMPVAEPKSADSMRTWVTLGAGRASAGGGGKCAVQTTAGKFHVDLAALTQANRDAKTHARPGALGRTLEKYGLYAAGLFVTNEAAGPAAVIMDGAGNVARPGRRHAILMWDWDPLYFEQPGPRSTQQPTRSEVLNSADRVIGSYLHDLKNTDSLIAIVCPEQPYYANPETQKSMGPVILYETRDPQQGLLYTDLTRWPGVITASDFAPTVLQWWGIPPDPSMEGHALRVRPGGPADLDRLDREMTDHYRWSFTAIPAHMVFGAALVILGVLAALWRPLWFRRFGIPSLAFALLPIGYLLAHVAGVTSLGALLAFGFAAAFLIAGIARACCEKQPALPTLTIPMLAGAAILGIETMAGNHHTIISAYAPPPLSGLRFYGLGNEHMGFLVGLTVIGLAAFWEWRPKRGAVVAVASVLLVLVVSAPFWGANWGGGIAAAFTVLLFWLLAKRPRWFVGLPVAVALMAVAALLPGVLDILISPSAGTRTHIGAATAALFSNHTGSLGEMVHRKLATSLWVFCYTIWTPILAAVTVAAFWVLLRKGGPVRTALVGQQKLAAGIAAALAGGVVSSIVNDSGIVAGAGLWCAALGACLYVAGRPQETRA